MAVITENGIWIKEKNDNKNVSFIKDVTLSTSAFGAEYDNALSGVLSFEQKEANIDGISGNFRLGSSEAGITFEGPVSIINDKETSFIFSVRRSYLQFLFKAFGFSFLPDYWDYQMKIRHKIDDYNYINIIGIGSIDKLTVNEPEEFDFENQSTIEQIPVIKQNSRTFGISWKRTFKNKSGYFTASLSNNRLENNFKRFKNNVQEIDPVYSNVSVEDETKLRLISTHNLNNYKIDEIIISDANSKDGTINIIKSYIKFGHNIKFDLIWLWESGFKYEGRVYDTMVGEYLLQRGVGISLKLKHCNQ